MLKINSISLPVDQDLQRKIRKTLSAKHVAEYENGKLGCYDARTIFYDIFLDDDCQTLVAIGPPLLNLEDSLFSAYVKIGSDRIKLNQTIKYKKLAVFKAKLPKPIAGLTTYEIIFSTGFKQTLKLTPEDFYPKGKTLVTLQKNNEIHWIRDWVLYYRQAFGVEHVYIYDNNSGYQDKLESLLGLEKVHVIPWNFPHGIAQGSSNKFCQVGALNHFHLRFGKKAILFNFDIDELLVCKDEKIRQDINNGKRLSFDGFNLPFDPALESKMYSFRDFKYKFPQPQKSAYKYVGALARKSILNVHYADRFAHLPKLVYRMIPERLKKGVVVSTNKAYFLHYRGISTNWKAHYADRLSNKPSLEKLNVVVDESALPVLLASQAEQL